MSQTELNASAEQTELTEVATQAVKSKSKRPKKSDQMSVHTEPGDNERYLRHSMKILALPPIDTSDIEALQSRITEYFNLCADEDMKPSVPGLALSLRITRQTLWRWSQETEKPERSDTIKRAYCVLDLLMDAYMQNGKINPVSGIFLMKNNHGYTDKQELVVTPQKPLDSDLTRNPEELRRQYLESVPELAEPQDYAEGGTDF